MEAFAYRIVQTGYSNSLFFSWGMLLAFAAVVVFLTTPKFRLGRAAYFSVMGLCILFFGMRYFIDGFFQDAVKNDYLFKLVLASYSCLTIGAVLLGLASAARSNDAYGHWKNWYLGFIPLVSLVLLFKSPQESVKLGFPRVAGNILLVVLGLLLFGSGRMLVVFTDLDSRQTAGNTQNDAQFQEKVRQYEVQNRGLTGFVQELARNTHYPYTIDEYTVLTLAEAEETTFRLVYKRASLSEPYPPVMLSQKTHELCSQPDSISLMDKGVTIEKKYVGDQDVPLGEVRGNTELCAQLQAQIPQIVQGLVDFFKVPRQIDDATTWTGSEYKDGEVNIYHDYTGSPEDIKWDDVKYRLCGLFNSVFAFGVDVRGVYRTPQKAEIADLVVTDASCAAFRSE